MCSEKEEVVSKDTRRERWRISAAPLFIKYRNQGP
jgi:hypothetical protein